MTSSRQDWWLSKIIPGIISGVVTGVILYYALPQAVAALMAERGVPTASAITETPTYYPCVACEREVTPRW